jgi:hypothetical protein
MDKNMSELYIIYNKLKDNNRFNNKHIYMFKPILRYLTSLENNPYNDIYNILSSELGILWLKKMTLSKKTQTVSFLLKIIKWPLIEDNLGLKALIYAYNKKNYGCKFIENNEELLLLSAKVYGEPYYWNLELKKLSEENYYNLICHLSDNNYEIPYASYCPYQTERIINKFIKYYPNTLSLIKIENQTQNLVNYAVENGFSGLYYIDEKYRTEYVINKCIELLPRNIQILDIQPFELIMKALNCKDDINFPLYLCHIKEKNQTYDIVKLFVERNRDNIKDAYVQYEDLILLSLTTRKNISSLISLSEIKEIFRTPEVIKAYISINGYNIKYLLPNEQTEELCILAIKQNKSAIVNIHPDNITIELDALFHDDD